MNRIKRAKRRAAYLLARSLIFAFSAVPRSLAITIGSWVGLAAWWLIEKDQHKMERHLRIAYKDKLSTSQRKRIGRNFYINSGRNYADVLRLSKHPVNKLEQFVSIEGLSHLEEAYLAGKGVIAVGGHIGNYELLGVFLVSFGFRVAVIGRELYDKQLDKLLVGIRESNGIVNFRTTDKIKLLIDWLRSGGLLGVLIDTDSHRVRSIPVPFFGRMSNTPIGQMLLGLRAGSAFCPIACVRTENNHYRIIIRPAVNIERSGSPHNDAARLTALCANELEKIIDSNREQWIWLHNRWHTKFESAA